MSLVTRTMTSPFVAVTLDVKAPSAETVALPLLAVTVPVISPDKSETVAVVAA